MASAPIVYRGDEGFRDGFLALARRLAKRGPIAKHYLHLGERQRQTYFGDGKDVALKKLFYALRPAATLRWMRMRPEEPIAPMHFPTLMAESDPPQDVAALVGKLLEKKAQTRELGSAPLPLPIADFIDSEFALARKEFEGACFRISEEARSEAEAFFRESVTQFALR